MRCKNHKNSYTKNVIIPHVKFGILNMVPAVRFFHDTVDITNLIFKLINCSVLVYRWK